MDAEVSSTTFYDESDQSNINKKSSNTFSTIENKVIDQSFTNTTSPPPNSTSDLVVDSNEDH